MGGLFGGALAAMQAVGELQARIEYRLLGADEEEIAEEIPAPVQVTPGWRKSLARWLVRLSDRIAPELRPVRRLDPCPC